MEIDASLSLFESASTAIVEIRPLSKTTLDDAFEFFCPLRKVWRLLWGNIGIGEKQWIDNCYSPTKHHHYRKAPCMAFRPDLIRAF